ncbi:MAG: IS110 family transposase [Candidatus Aminicenantes bacterium]|nr:IS110 family transposase [Candidatus Aminicenantes bacterium]
MTVLAEDGRELKTGRVFNLRRNVETFLKGFHPFTAVLEAGRSSYVMADLLRELGGEVKMANALQVKAIAHARIKTDKRDSRTLAQLLRADLIPEIYQRGEDNRQAQRVMRARAYWVRIQTEIKNKIRALLAQQKEEIRLEVDKRKDGLFSARGVEFLSHLPLEGQDKRVLDDLRQGYQEVQAHIRASDGLVRALYGEIEEASRIDTIPGFATTLSVLVAVEIADVKRFSSPAHLHSYAGVIPSTYASGERMYHGRITKQGSRWLRWAVLEAVYPATKKDLGLRVLYSRLAKRKGPNAAKIAVARRLLTVIYRVLIEKRDYIPDRMNPSAA